MYICIRIYICICKSAMERGMEGVWKRDLLHRVEHPCLLHAELLERLGRNLLSLDS